MKMTAAAPHVILFNDERYQYCNLHPGQRSFRYDHLVGDRLVGTLSGVVADGLLDCGHSAPFGGIDLAHPHAGVPGVIDLMRNAIVHARADGISEIRVRARPGYFGPNETASE